MSFLKITSEHGSIGNLRWVNSRPSPHSDPYTLRLVTRWGGVGTIWNDPSRYIPFSDIIPFNTDS
jgi:hypothetical protein